MSKNESICSNVLSAYDSDIRLLDNVRTCIVLRIKCDREYATSLQLIAGNAGKKDLMRNTNQSSLAAAWSVIGQETETLSKLIRKRTDIMTKEVLEPLDKFTEEVKVTRKVFSDEKGKLDAEVHKAKTLLSKTKADYEKCLSVYVLNKSKFEHCTTHVTSPREQNSIYASLSIISRRTKNHVELKRKFLKAARKLHNVHNNYVMLCEEVQLLILDHKTRLEPYITTIQMGHLRELAERVKSILEAFVEVTDWTGEKFQALQWRIKNQLLTIQDKDDYKQLEDRIKLGLIDSQDVDATIKRRPVSSVNKMELSGMKFDDMLLKNHQGSLRAGSLAVDSFTFDSLKNIQYELQAKLVQCQQEMKSKEKLIQQKESEISALSTLCSGSGYDTMAIETSRTMVRNPNSRAITSVAIREKAIEVLRKELIELEAKHNRMHTIWEKLDGALATVKDSTVPLGVPMADEADIRLDHVTKVTSRVTRSETPGSQLSATYSVVANMGKYVVTQLGKVKGMAARSSPKPQVVPPSRLLKDEPWFHGALPREDVAKLLNENGDYFVRETVKSGETRLVVS
ncbi:Tyrosine-protein kinase Fer [Halotydeus destructor]|nr:Tyrosine-protein kinase Fer [Halotydeus destructor]